MATYHVGISGWRYPPWRGTFFPQGLPQKDELRYASRQVRSIEINGTFYSLQRASSFRRWRDATPENFVFAVKGPRFITHIKRLRDVRGPLANFFASGVLALEDKLGPILWQLPPNFSFDAGKLAEFFASLPRDTSTAARLARSHDHHVMEPVTRVRQNRILRHALEVRHPSFVSESFVALLREYDIALVVADTAGKWPLLEDVTSDFVYVRLHGDAQLYVSGYTATGLQGWARKLRTWHRGANTTEPQRIAQVAPFRKQGRDVFVYFDNDVKTQAPYDAMALAHLLKVGPRPPPAPDPRTVNEEPRVSSGWSGWRGARATSGKQKRTRSIPSRRR